MFCFSQGSAAQYRAHPCEQFCKRERFDKIIVCTQLESFHPITHTVTRGQKENGRANAIAPKFCNQFPAVLVREHDIDNQKIKLARASLRQPGFAIDCNIDSETGFAVPWPGTPPFFFRLRLRESALRKVRSLLVQQHYCFWEEGTAITRPASRNVIAAENKQ